MKLCGPTGNKREQRTLSSKGHDLKFPRHLHITEGKENGSVNLMNFDQFATKKIRGNIETEMVQAPWEVIASSRIICHANYT